MMSKEEKLLIYKELEELFHKGVKHQDAKILNTFVRDDRILLFKDVKFRTEYLSLRQYRAECFILFGMFSDAVKECRLALAFAENHQHWKIYLLWLKAHNLHFIHTDVKVELEAIAEAAIIVANKGKTSITKGKDAEYKSLCFCNNEAFYQLYLGQQEEAKKLYQKSEFKPIPITQYNDDKALSYLFANYAKGLAVAIELKDKNLLTNLLKVISIDDQTLYSQQSLFKIFHATLVTTMDTHPDFAKDFNQLFHLQEKVKEEMKELNFFLTSISANMTQALEVAFNVFK